jgi:hypothetical protein
VIYSKERLLDCKEELIPLLKEHYKEIAAYQEKINLAPDWEKYKQLDDSGILNIFTMRDNDVLVGYYICMVLPNLHYSEDLYSVNDIVLIKPAYRNKMNGVELFLYVEEEMIKQGVSVMTMHMKTSLPFDKLCEGLGWDYMERLYTKCLKG